MDATRSSREAERSEERAATFAWLLRLRWAAVAGQLVTVLGVRWLLAVPIALPPLLIVIAVEAASNVLAARVASHHPISELGLGSLIAADVLILAALLYFSGGAQNPFSFLFLVQITLAAMSLPWRWTWGLVALAMACLAGLYFGSVPLPMTHGQMMRLHLYGMWVASGVAGSFIVIFVGRVTGELQLSRARARREAEKASRAQRLASLATLAAGAAHELATPLGTIALVAEELERGLRDCEGAQALGEDAALIRAEVARCRGVLDELSADAARSPGETVTALDIGELLGELAAADSARLEVADAGSALTVKAPRNALKRALAALVDNARQASTEGAPVALRARRQGGRVSIEIEDSGIGMDAETLARVGEPFFTTKECGRGMGLGVLLSRTIIEGAGGSLSYESEPGAGTVAHVALPLEGAS